MKAGDTMTGALVLPADPATALQAATKQYADAHAVYPILSINGAMAISQELGTTGTSIHNGSPYVLDQFAVGAQGTPGLTGGQQASSLAGIANQLGVAVTTAAAALAAGDLGYIFQPIEGIRLGRLNWGAATAQPITIGFYIYCSIVGNICVAVTNAAAARSYLADVAITAANTWQWCTVTVPGDTLGTWPKNNALGMYLRWCFGGGTTYRGVAGWQAGNLLATNATMNLMASTANAIYLSSVVVVPGTVLPPTAAIPFILPTYDQELPSCYRYWEKIGMTLVLTSPPYANTSWFKATKRVAPTVTALSTTNGATVGTLSASPLDGLRQLTVASTVVDCSFSIDARL
jgi:hypothetical protein